MKSRGFTLIEAMIVVAIIGILLAITIPALQGYNARKNSRGGGGDYVAQPASRPDSVLTCREGFAFVKEMGGDWKPHTDGRGNAVKCQ